MTDSLFDRKHSNLDMPLLDPEACRELLALVNDRSHPRRITALRFLVRGGCDELAELLERLLFDESETQAIRASAATQLSDITRTSAQPILLRALHVKDSLVVGRVARSLGRIGDFEALDALRYYRDAAPESVNETIFARAVIAHRLRTDGDRPPWRPPLSLRKGEDDEVDSLEIIPIRDRDLVIQIEAFDGPRYGIELSQRIGFQVFCEDEVACQVFLNRDLEGFDVDALVERPALVGLVACYKEETSLMSNAMNPQYALQSLVISTPSADGVEMGVYHLHGEPYYTAIGKREGDRLVFHFGAADGPGRYPISIVGRWGAGTFDFDEGQMLPRLPRYALQQET